MPQRKDQTDCTCATLRERLAFNILLDELAIAALSDALALLHATGDPGATQIEHTIRTHRIAILKQRVILGAAASNSNDRGGALRRAGEEISRDRNVQLPDRGMGAQEAGRFPGCRP